MTSQRRQFESFEEFWPYYVGEHRHPACRGLHYVSALVAIALLVVAVVERQLLWVLAIPACSYGIAWIAHFFIEGNRPATWGWVWWSLRGEARMFWLFVTGRMRREVDRVCGETER